MPVASLLLTKRFCRRPRILHILFGASPSFFTVVKIARASNRRSQCVEKCATFSHTSPELYQGGCGSHPGPRRPQKAYKAYKAYKFDVFEPVGHFLRICMPSYTFARSNLVFVPFVRLLGPPRAWVAPAAPLGTVVGKRAIFWHTSPHTCYANLRLAHLSIH